MKKNLLEDISNRLSNITDDRKRKLVTSILKKDNWYEIIDFDTVISILMDLGYTKEEAVSFYEKLIIPE